MRAALGGSAEPPVRCVCYGLGRFSGCPAARYQLALLLLLLEELGVSTGRGPAPEQGPRGGHRERGRDRDRDRCPPRPRPLLSPQVPRGCCSLFDPAFSAQEVAALGQLGLHVLPENEVSGAARLHTPPGPLRATCRAPL